MKFCIFLAISRAFSEISIAEISAFGKCFFKVIGIIPLPVPTSNNFKFWILDFRF
jgi:hypothetical protein